MNLEHSVMPTNPQRPRRAEPQPVRAWPGELVLPTYLPAAPDRHPMFFEKRVYQGSSGKVYPLPFTDRLAEKPVERKWKAVWLENEFLRVLVLPELGGRIHAILDKTNGYDLVYNQRVIKPALVGLAGPWLSGGIEFNWPQHHRPGTFLPVDCQIEEPGDGSMTLWCSDHDPMARMKGMHGVCLHPGRAVVELKARVYNRTPLVQTFLWWANVATRVHEAYQSFLPPDVYCVADHARRSMSEYPLAQGAYYGVNYGERGRAGVPPRECPSQFVPPHCLERPGHRRDTTQGAPATRSLEGVPHYAPNDLSFYANIPTPCSYMCVGTSEGFLGGYDYLARAGLVHFANPHLSPGKKQWTWGNHDFGYAWDRNLTEKDSRGQYGPYVEIMAGVYSDNQPDFSFLQPGETKTWSQFWYPIQQIGPAHHANLEAAVSLKTENGKVRAGVCVTRTFKSARVSLHHRARTLLSRHCDLAPGRPLVVQAALPRRGKETSLALRVTDMDGREIISYQPRARLQGAVPPPAGEPPAPRDVASADELYLIGLHLEQYLHATRCPALYWREALRRDPLDARCNNALGLWHLRRGQFASANAHFRKAIERLTRRNANPYDGEAYYNLGLCLRFQLDSGSKPQTRGPAFAEAYASFYKATWNQAWASAGYHALAEMECRRADWEAALDHLERSLRLNTDNTRARNLKVIVLRKLNRAAEAGALVRDTIALDPVDWWARRLSGEPLRCDLQARLDLAHDCARAGLYAEAIGLLEKAVAPKRDLPDQSWGAWPLVYYTLGWLHEQAGDTRAAHAARRRAALEPPDYCFPARLEEIAILEMAMRANPRDARAPYYLGNLLYDRRRHVEAIRLWERSARLEPGFAIVWRNLGLGCFNISKDPAKARAAYEKAFHAEPGSARLLFERDQLWKRLGEKPERRLRELEKFPGLVPQRDDLSLELCALYNQTGRPLQAVALLGSRRFHPWEGGEGGPLGQHVRSHLALGRQALAGGDAEQARDHFQTALCAPSNLGEAKHLLANHSDVHYWLGVALAALGEKAAARNQWLAAATFKGDFQTMSLRAFSEMTYYSALSWEKLGQKAKAKRLLRDLLAYALKLQKTPARIDYFATSLPAMLLFEDDLQSRQETTALFLQGQAWLGLGNHARARKLLALVLRRDPNHAPAADLPIRMP
jgi:tetratricopeptide (TPR) repeat protein